MQTFLPYPNYRLAAHVMDSRRLGKQRVECIQILRMNAGIREGGSHRFHPATVMWHGYEPSLCLYTHCILEEWVQRGYVNHMLSPRTEDGCRLYDLPLSWASVPTEDPPWLGHPRLHSSHRAALLKKDPYWYAQFGWDEPAVLDYWWPGKMPQPGDYLVSPDGHPHLVVALERGGRGAVALNSSTGLEVHVSRSDIVRRVWQRGIRSDM